MDEGLSSIAARFIKPYLALAGAQLSELGLERIDFDDPEARVDFATALQVFAVGERVSGRDDLGIVGAQRDAGTLRIFEYMSRVSRSPLDALEKVARYQNLVHDACLFTLERRESSVVASMGSRADVPFPKVVADFFMASLVMGLYRLGVPAEGASVSLVRGAPADMGPFERVFRCPIRFGAESNAATFPLAGLTRTLPDADPALCAVLELHAERMLARLPKGQPILDDVRRWLARNLADGDLSLSTVAKSLGMSERTLRRRLNEHGTSFQALIDEVRAEVASDYLEDTDLTLEEMAFLLGFSDASAFRRAYARWHGHNVPSRRRQGIRST